MQNLLNDILYINNTIQLNYKWEKSQIITKLIKEKGVT